MASADTILDVTDVTKRFGELVAADAVSFGIERGTFVGTIGPNGSGKATPCKLLTGVFSPTPGTVRLDGEDCTGNGVR